MHNAAPGRREAFERDQPVFEHTQLYMQTMLGRKLELPTRGEDIARISQAGKLGPAVGLLSPGTRAARQYTQHSGIAPATQHSPGLCEPHYG